MKAFRLTFRCIRCIYSFIDNDIMSHWWNFLLRYQYHAAGTAV